MRYLKRIIVPAERTSIATRVGDMDLTTDMPATDAFTVHSRFAVVIVPTSTSVHAPPWMGFDVNVTLTVALCIVSCAVGRGGEGDGDLAGTETEEGKAEEEEESGEDE